MWNLTGNLFWFLHQKELLLRSTHEANWKTIGSMYSVEFANRFVNIHTLFNHCFRSVVVITSASHAEGRRFEPGRKHSFLLRLLTGVAFYWYHVSISLWNASYGIFCFWIKVSRPGTCVSCNIAHIDALQRTKAEYWYQPVKRKRLFENPGFDPSTFRMLTDLIAMSTCGSVKKFLTIWKPVLEIWPGNWV